MGTRDLRDLAAIEPIDVEEIAGGRGAVDAYNWLYRYITIRAKFTDREVYTTEDGTNVVNLLGLIKGIPKFFEHDISPVFVFDGEVSQLKESEVERRHEQTRRAAVRAAMAEKRGEEVEAAKWESRAQHLSKVMDETSREVLDLLDVPHVRAPAEGEAQAAHMARQETVDYAITEDYDALLYGAPITVRKFTTRGNPERMCLDATLERHEITREQLVTIAILCGTDYNDGIRGVGPKTALDLVHEHGSLDAILAECGEDLEDADAIRDLFLTPDVQDVEVTWDIDPDLEATWDYLTDEWELPGEELDRAFERLAESTGSEWEPS